MYKFLFFRNRKPMVEVVNSKMYLKHCLSDFIELCQYSRYQDITIVAENGSLNVNSILLTSVFPILRKILSEIKSEIILVDLNIELLAKFFKSIYNKEDYLPVPALFGQLMNKTDYFIKSEHIVDDLKEVANDDDIDNELTNFFNDDTCDNLNNDNNIEAKNEESDPVVVSLKKKMKFKSLRRAKLVNFWQISS